MAEVILKSYVCDECATQLSGKSGTAEVKKRYISMIGQISLQSWSVHSEREHCFISRKPGEMMTFCDEKCFGAFVLRREKEWKQYQMRMLREEAEQEEAFRRKY